ncbi:MAG: SDR family NAD(P)-dependent oxidoreductase [Pseudomonadales bacterium]|nr:SDR family NAD(P)-dependent oxidoreductase [Pseudomonadales bacterium]
MSQVWLITGGNRGLGAAIAHAAIKAGHHVAITARNPESAENHVSVEGEQLVVLRADVTSVEEMQSAVDATVAAFGRIDVLVNNAGYGQLGNFEEVSQQGVEQQFATNVFGTMHVTRAVLPVMRRQRSGRIFNISSMAGYRGFGGGAIYGASKFAVEGLSEALAEEVKDFGIQVTIVEPGYFRTDFLDSSSMKMGSIEIDDYQELSAARQKARQSYNHQQQGDPDKLAAALVFLAAQPEPPLHFAVGDDAIQAIEEKNARVQQDIDRWRTLSVETKYTES